MAKRNPTDILSAILETLDEIFLNQQKEESLPEEKKGKGKKKKKTDSSDQEKPMMLNNSFDVLENIKLDKQKALDLAVFTSALKTLSSIDNKKLEKNINSTIKLIDSLGKIKIDGPKLQQSLASLAPIINSVALLATVSIFKLWTAMQFLTEKNANRIGQFIVALVNSIKGLKVEKDLEPLATFTKGITDILALFTDKTKDFNPITGKIKGWQINLYFGAIQGPLKKAIEKFKDVFNQLQEINKTSIPLLESFINTLTSLKWKQIKKLNENLSKLNIKSAENFVNFTKKLLEAVPKKETKVNALNKLLESLSSLSFVSIFTLWLAGKMLDEKIGDNIGKCLKSLVNKVPTEKKVQNFQKTLKSINSSMLVLMALVVVLTVLAKWDWKALLVGIAAMAGVMLVFTGFLLLLSFERIQKALNETSKNILLITASVLLMTVTIGLILYMSTFSEKINWLAVLGIFVGMGAMVLLMWGLSKVVHDHGKDILMGTLAMILLLGGISFIVKNLIIPIGELWEDALKGSLVVFGIITVLGLIIWTLGKVAEKCAETLIFGTIFLVTITGVLWLMGKAFVPFISMMQQLNDMSWKDIGNAALKIVAILGGFTAIIAGLGLIVMNPVAMAVLGVGSVALGLISVMIYGISKAVGDFLDVVQKTTELNPEKIKSFVNALVGDDKTPGLVFAIKKTISALADIGPWAAIKAKFVSKMITPIFTAVGKFVDVLVQMANGQYVKEYDKEGKPVYGRITEQMYVDAATAIASGFSIFINNMGDAFEGLSRSSLRAMNKMKDSIGPVMEAVGSFANAIILLASGTYTDANGKQQRMKKDDYIKAGNILAESFLSFILEMGKVDKDEIKKSVKNINKLMKSDLSTFINVVKQISDVLVDVCKTIAESNIDVIQYARTTGTALSTFFNSIKITQDLDDLADDLKDGVKAMKHSKTIMTSLAESFDTESSELFMEAIVNYGAAFGSLFNTMETLFTKKRLSVLEDRVDDFTDMMSSLKKTTKKGIDVSKDLIKTTKSLSTVLTNLSEIINDKHSTVVTLMSDMERLNELLENIDNQLISKLNERLEALKKTTNAVSKLSEALSEVNKGLQRNIELENKQRRMEQFHLFEWISSAKRSDTPIKTEEYVEAVKKENANQASEQTANNQTNNSGKASSKDLNKQNSGQPSFIDPTQFAQIVGNVLKTTLETWVHNEKTLFVEYKDGEVRRLTQK